MAEQSFRKAMESVGKTKWGSIAVLLITGLACYLVLAVASTVCFSYLLIAIMAYGIPFLFGVRGMKKMLVYGLVLFLALGLAFGVQMYMQYTGGGGITVSSADGVLIDGIVEPYRGDNGTLHHFSVQVTEIDYDEVHLIYQNRLSTDDPVNLSSSGFVNISGGRTYFFNETIGEGLFQYQFQANGTSGWTFTSIGTGPVNVPDSYLLQQLLISSILLVFFQIGILFFLILALVWVSDRSKKTMQEAMKKEKERMAPSPQEKVVCSECGSEVPFNAKECPQCGEPFEDEEGEEEGEFMCTECGATVKESDARCWKCGKEFEN